MRWLLVSPVAASVSSAHARKQLKTIKRRNSVTRELTVKEWMYTTRTCAYYPLALKCVDRTSACVLPQASASIIIAVCTKEGGRDQWGRYANDVRRCGMRRRAQTQAYSHKNPIQRLPTPSPLSSRRLLFCFCSVGVGFVQADRSKRRLLSHVVVLIKAKGFQRCPVFGRMHKRQGKRC